MARKISTDIQEAAAIIRRGGLVAFPTETVYGLGANALDAAAVERIYEAKGRPPTSPLIVHVDSAGMARELTRVWPAAAERLAARFWPGPLTLVLPKRPHIPDRVTAGLPTVGVRVPAHPIARALIEAAGLPIAAPSANRFTELSPTTAEHVARSLDAVDLILDGGPTTVGIESTVLSLAGEQPVLLRPGMIPVSDLEAIVGALGRAANVEGAHPSPGMHHRHYSPKTPVLLGEPPDGGRGAYLWWQSERPAAKLIRMPLDAATYGSCLYSVLHELDREGWDFIAIEPPPDSPEWAGIRDRLIRAARS